MEKIINVKDVKFVALKYYEENKGVEVGDPVSYAFLIKHKGLYINPFSPLDLYPVFERVTYYSNTTLDGEDYGAKVMLINNIENTGPCYVILGEKVFDKDEISISELEEYMLRSKYFFKDRFSIAERRFKEFRNPLKMYNIMRKDQENHKKMEDFYSKRNVEMIKIKSR